MPSMKNINEAVNDLKETVVSRGFSDEFVNEIAEEWDVHPAALVRKFEEKTGNHPKDFSRSNVKIDYKKIYEDGMKRAWRSHPKMFWDALSQKEQEETKKFLDRHLVKKDVLQIVWK